VKLDGRTGDGTDVSAAGEASEERALDALLS
jgi:hypothetical protein